MESIYSRWHVFKGGMGRKCRVNICLSPTGRPKGGGEGGCAHWVRVLAARSGKPNAAYKGGQHRHSKLVLLPPVQPLLFFLFATAVVVRRALDNTTNGGHTCLSSASNKAPLSWGSAGSSFAQQVY
jgi:hypothetical protein